MSWANVVKAAAPEEPAVTAPPSALTAEAATIAVVDANAIINGIRFERIASAVVTIPEVLNEVRDKQSRQFLASLPFGIETKEPSKESMAAVLLFARETGDIHVLSSVDLKLLALAHTLEVAAHGTAHIREHPVPPTVKPKTRHSGRQLPGWGRVPNPSDWKVVDEAPDEDSHGGAGSRIVTQMHALDLSLGLEMPTPAAEAAPAAVLSALDDLPSLPPPLPLPPHPQPVHAARDEAPAQAEPSATTSIPGSEESSAGASTAPVPQPLPSPADRRQEGEEEEEEEWATAGKSRNAARRKQRKQMLWEGRQQQRGVDVRADFSAVARKPAVVEEVEAAAAAAAQEVEAEGDGAEVAESSAREQQGLVEGGKENEEEGSSDEDEDDDDDDDDDDDEEEGEEGEECTEEGSEEAHDDGLSEAAQSSGGGGGGEQEQLRINSTSTVLSVTADFAMQNVLLQMGLRLVSRDGKQISRLSRWALRCHACFHVTKEGTRLFCPRCGNMTMERVEVAVGPDGTEFFGVRKKHCLKGTVFSLPKPKGGRANNPVLSEDMLMLKMGKKLRRKERKAAEAAADDPFAPGLGADSWAKMQQAVAGDKGTAFMMTNWKNNPNERKNARNNRRG